MGGTKERRNPPPTNLASLIRGLYGRVARRLNVDPSYVSRVARGERQSRAIEASLERELRRIMSLVRTRDGTGRRTPKRTNVGSRKKVRV